MNPDLIFELNKQLLIENFSSNLLDIPFLSNFDCYLENMPSEYYSKNIPQILPNGQLNLTTISDALTNILTLSFERKGLSHRKSFQLIVNEEGIEIKGLFEFYI